MLSVKIIYFSRLKDVQSAESCPLSSAAVRLCSTGKNRTEEIHETGTRTEHHGNNIGGIYFKIKVEVFRCVSIISFKYARKCRIIFFLHLVTYVLSDAPEIMSVVPTNTQHPDQGTASLSTEIQQQRTDWRLHQMEKSSLTKRVRAFYIFLKMHKQ